MKKSEIKKVTNNELITEYVRTYSLRDVNWILERGTERLSRQCKDLERELIARGILTTEDVNYLNR